MPKSLEITFLAKARSWASKRGLFGPQAFLKYVILSFVECLNESTDEFIFKGGNLLWIYIKTPRQTVDLDLATRSIFRASEVESHLNKACEMGQSKGIKYKLSQFQILEEKSSKAAKATIEYKTDTGVSNRFELDVVFASPTDIRELNSPINNNHTMPVASIENIIADKLSASHQFGAGNTRMKDFDDLWRISKAEISVSPKSLTKILKKRKIKNRLNEEWISRGMESDWKRHASRYKDLPKNLRELFSEVNKWLTRIDS
jgi:hypothetical protein